MRTINRDTVPHLVNTAFNVLKGYAGTGITRVAAYWWNVQLGSGCQFYGSPLFRRLPGSRIVIGRNCVFRSAFWSNLVGLNRRCILATLDARAEIQIGEGCGLSGTVICAAERVSLGRRVMAGANTVITDTDWHPLDPAGRAGGVAGACAPVVIEDDVWLGLNVIVLKGVTIGAGAVIAANSVVISTIPPRVLAAGIPARVVKAIPE